MRVQIPSLEGSILKAKMGTCPAVDILKATQQGAAPVSVNGCNCCAASVTTASSNIASANLTYGGYTIMTGLSLEPRHVLAITYDIYMNKNPSS